jgi:hypothetical protein
MVACGASTGNDGGADGGPPISDAGPLAWDAGPPPTDGGVQLCYVNQGLGGNCGYFLPDRTASPGGLCGDQRMSSSCFCSKAADAGYAVFCTGGCVPTLDGGTEVTCGQGLGCGYIDCGAGTTCVGPSHCQ